MDRSETTYGQGGILRLSKIIWGGHLELFFKSILFPFKAPSCFVTYGKSPAHKIQMPGDLHALSLSWCSTAFNRESALPWCYSERQWIIYGRKNRVLLSKCPIQSRSAQVTYRPPYFNNADSRITCTKYMWAVESFFFYICLVTFPFNEKSCRRCIKMLN